MSESIDDLLKLPSGTLFGAPLSSIAYVRIPFDGTRESAERATLIMKQLAALFEATLDGMNHRMERGFKRWDQTNAASFSFMRVSLTTKEGVYLSQEVDTFETLVLGFRGRRIVSLGCWSQDDVKAMLIDEPDTIVLGGPKEVAG